MISWNYYKATFTCQVRPCATLRGSWFYFLCFGNGRDFGVFVCCLVTASGVAIMGGVRYFFKRKCSLGLFHAWFPRILLPAGRKISILDDSTAPSKYQICVIPTSEVKLESKKKSDWVTTTKQVVNELRYNKMAIIWALSLPIAQSYAGLILFVFDFCLFRQKDRGKSGIPLNSYPPCSPGKCCQSAV